MENPFIFGKPVDGESFTDRKEDTKRLEANLIHGVNTILISPRRWGKTSLVKEVISQIEQHNIKVVFIDVFRCKSEYDFYQRFALAIIKQTSTKLEEWVEMAKGFLSHISPKFSFGTDPLNDFSFSFEWNPKLGTEESILDLPEKIAFKKNLKLIICLDEFQQVAEIQDDETFQKKMRSVWQHQKNVTYCIFGSKKHLMEKFFNHKGMPFYKFGDLIFLKKIPTSEWIPFICDKFKNTGKIITPEQAIRICELTENHSFYVQQLSWLIWFKTEAVVEDKDIESALELLIEQNAGFFQSDIEQITGYQLNFLQAMADGVSSGFSRIEIIKEYNLETSSNVQSIKKALISKDLIYKEGKDLYFDDPIMKLWLKRSEY